MAELIRTKTGLQGLDKALNGGIPEGNLVLVSGGAGTGKSTLCLQFLVNGAKLFGEKGLYISTEQNHEEILKQAKSFGWDLESLELNKLLKIAYLDITEGDNFLKKIDDLVLQFQPKRIAIDSVTTLTDALMVSGIADDKPFTLVQVIETVSPIPKTEQIVAKSILYKLVKELKKYKKTVLLTSELPETGETLSSDGISEFITDGIILLGIKDIAKKSVRSIKIRKMRQTSHNLDNLILELMPTGLVVTEESIFTGDKISGIIH